MDSLAELFSHFYKAVNGNSPYQWQTRLMQSVASEGMWPSKIAAPTSAGKTAVIEVHIFLNAFAGSYGIPQSLPRRLCLAVNRRALVDSQYCHAQDIAKELSDALHEETAGVLRVVARGLLKRQGIGWDKQDVEPLLVRSMHGGAGGMGSDRTWRTHPEAPMVIDSTPDMFGSRLLFRGYGVSRRARSIEAGLLSYDTVLIVDEAHLNQQLVLTARQVKRLEGLSSFDTSDVFSPMPLQVVESTATQTHGGREDDETISVRDEDLAADPCLAKRVGRLKRVELETCPKKSEVDEIVKRCLQLRDEGLGPIAVILNTVGKVLQVDARLKEECVDDDRTICVLGRMRPFDRIEALKDLLDRSQTGTSRFIVGTQALEVGIDYDCACMVTELAPAQSLVQRLGRVNRRGEYKDGLLVVFDSSDQKGNKQGGPYSSDDLKDSREWIKGLPKEGVSSQWLSSHVISGTSLERPVLQRLESWDVNYLSHTDEDLAAESGCQSDDHARADLNLWLRDELKDDGENDLGIVVRNLPGDDMLALALISRVPPLPEEVIPCSNRRFVGLCEKAQSKNEDGTQRSFISRDGSPFSLSQLPADRLPAGTTVILDADAAPFFRSGVAVSSYEEGLQADDIYANLVARDIKETGCLHEPVILGDLLRACGMEEESVALDSLVKSFCERQETEDSQFDSEDQKDTSIDRSEELENYLVDSGKLSAWTIELIKSQVLELLLDDDGEDQITWEGIVCRPSLDDASSSGYEVSATRPIPLDEHEQDVCELLRKLVATVGLTGNLALTLCDAALWHDEGKRDKNFQRMLHGGRESKSVLAKSKSMTRAKSQGLYNTLGLHGWRHEQLSAALAWAEYEGPGERKLLVRLVGTSHGHGRDSFIKGNCSTSDLSEDGSVQATCASEIEALYRMGRWETIVHSTDEKYGCWKMAYLEALLRAADVRVSAGDESWK